MAIFETGLRTSVVTIAAAALEIRAHASRMTRVHEIEVAIAAATASVFGLGRPAAAGTTGTNNAPPAPDTDDVTAYGGVIILAGWGVVPTVPASFFRRFNLPAVIGEKQIYRPRNPIEIPAGGSLVLWNITANGVADVNLVIEDVGT